MSDTGLEPTISRGLEYTKTYNHLCSKICPVLSSKNFHKIYPCANESSVVTASRNISAICLLLSAIEQESYKKCLFYLVNIADF